MYAYFRLEAVGKRKSWRGCNMSIEAKQNMTDDVEARKNWTVVVNGHCWRLNEQESLAAAREVKDKEHVLRMADDICSLRLDIDNYPTLGTQILKHIIGNELLPLGDARHLLRLKSDRDCLFSLVERSDLTPEILEEVADDDELRTLAAYYTKNPDTLAVLAFDPNPGIRWYAVENKNIRKSVLETVALTDIDLSIAAKATEQLTRQEILSQVYNRLRVENNADLAGAIANNPHTDISMVEKMAAETDVIKVKTGAAKRSQNPELLRQLSSSLSQKYDADLADALKQNEAAPKDVRVVAALLGPKP